MWFKHLFLDIGANLTDTMYQGEYHGSKKHEPDLEQVLDRSWNQGLDKIIITGGSLQESKKSIELAKTNDRYVSNLFFANCKIDFTEKNPIKL